VSKISGAIHLTDRCLKQWFVNAIDWHTPLQTCTKFSKGCANLCVALSLSFFCFHSWYDLAHTNNPIQGNVIMFGNPPIFKGRLK
jgi:hypothetical protein